MGTCDVSGRYTVALGWSARASISQQHTDFNRVPWLPNIFPVTHLSLNQELTPLAEKNGPKTDLRPDRSLKCHAGHLLI